MTSNKSIMAFFWQHIAPFKWYYLVMLSAPLISSFFPFAYNYAIKLFIDTMAAHSTDLTYQAMLAPIVLFALAQITTDLVWRLSNIAEWKSEPYVRRSIILQTYDYVQHHDYLFFQNNFSGAISSKLKGILDGYDKFWAEMHHGVLSLILRCTVSISALLFVNVNLGGFVLVWGIVYVVILYSCHYA